MVKWISLVALMVIATSDAQTEVNRNVNDPNYNCPARRWTCPDLEEMVTEVCTSSKFSSTIHPFAQDEQANIFSSDNTIGDIITADVDQDGMRM